MPRLTVPPNFIGTTGSDSLIGEQLNVSVAIGIDILTGGFICTRSGKDTITGIATGTNDLEGSSNGGTGRGIANSGKLNAGDGEDTITGTGTGGNGGKGIELAPGGDGGSAIGITNTGSLNTENRNDAIAGTRVQGLAATAEL
ncbi:MAG: hypothetical protein V7K25_19610 [Nostoc sp.]|uniref:hypothetical protein n=1 Tax=Nostoc sp. TaxID=1180 RepID=UPI002FFD42F3